MGSLTGEGEVWDGERRLARVCFDLRARSDGGLPSCHGVAAEIEMAHVDCRNQTNGLATIPPAAVKDTGHVKRKNVCPPLSLS